MLLPDHDYIGIDRVVNNIEYCNEIFKYRSLFMYVDAEKYIETVQKLNPIFIFSIDYLSLPVMEEYIKKMDDIFIAVHYNKPYKSLTSVYSENELLFETIHNRKTIDQRLNLIQKYGGKTYRLLEHDYYYVSIIKKECLND